MKKLLRRSFQKYNVCKLIKMSAKFKMSDFLLDLGHGICSTSVSHFIHFEESFQGLRCLQNFMSYGACYSCQKYGKKKKKSY